MVLGYLFETDWAYCVPILTHALLNLTTTIVLAYSILQTPAPVVPPAANAAPSVQIIPYLNQ